MTRLPAWQRAVAAIGALKVSCAIPLLIAAALLPGRQVGPKELVMFANVAAFGASAAALLIGSARDRRAALLGLVLLLEASAYADRMFDPFDARPGIIIEALRVAYSLRVDAFAPFFLWSFVAEFPRAMTMGALRRVTRLFTSAALITGVALFGLNSIMLLGRYVPGIAIVTHALGPVGRDSPADIYWTLVFSLSLPALAALVLRARNAGAEERRRVRLLVAGLVLCSAPPVTWALLTALSPGFARALPVERAGWIVYPALLAAPVWTAYAVLVHQALDVRLVLRRAVRYALQRQTVIVLATIPFILFAAEVWRGRHESVSDLLTNTDGALLAAFAILGVVTLRGRRVALERLDRRFFREQYDARRILAQLVDECRRASSRRQLAEVLRREIDLALHPESVNLLFLDAGTRTLRDSSEHVRPLAIATRLAVLAQESGGPIDTQPESSQSPLLGLPAEEQMWLVDHAIRLLVPLADADRRLVGLLVLGEKKSELPYSGEDRFLLAAVASAAALSLAYVSADPVAPPPLGMGVTERASDAAASECVACGLLEPAGRAICSRCGARSEPSSVPLTIAGKFRLIERIGQGGMGVVYRGLDTQLDRPVAIKTLPSLKPDQAWRLRREARALASVSHPNLALIYGGESWQGTPMLVLEYLAGGTLADRIAHGPMATPDVLEIGIALADVVAAIHRAGILHRDIKPTNVGFTNTGALKLLDFGIARLLGSAQRRVPDDRESRAGVLEAMRNSSDQLRVATTMDGQLVGTPLYMSPLAVSGEAPERSFDVWSVCVVLYEAAAGVNPFEDTSIAAILHRILTYNAADLRMHVASAPEPLANLFRDAFSPSASVRPATADDLLDRLRGLRRVLVDGPPVAETRR